MILRHDWRALEITGLVLVLLATGWQLFWEDPATALATAEGSLRGEEKLRVIHIQLEHLQNGQRDSSQIVPFDDQASRDQHFRKTDRWNT